MKKVLCLLLALVMCISLSACGGETVPGSQTESTKETELATVITNENKTLKVSAQDLFNEFDSNEARFAKIYAGATIDFVGTVKYIKTKTGVYNGDSVSTNQNKIVFEEGWCLILGADNIKYDLANYFPGQKLRVTTGIVSAAFDTEFLQSVADNNRVVWLVGNDEIHYEKYNSQTTTITIEE